MWEGKGIVHIFSKLHIANTPHSLSLYEFGHVVNKLRQGLLFVFDYDRVTGTTLAFFQKQA